jgi:uncharacterized protein YcbK (DUF882 family)
MTPINFNTETGFYTWTKGTDVKLSDHFTTHEFACPCTHPECQEQRISAALIDKLERLRAALGAAIRITSGYRCSRYQADLRARGFETAAGVSEHELGQAADLQCAAHSGPDLAVLAALLFRAVGIAATWIHVDLRADKLRRWTYGSVKV